MNTDHSATATGHGWQAGEHLMVNSGLLRYHVVVSGSGPVVALVAGFPQTAYAWRRVAPLLAEDHTVIAIDLPGQGDSDKPADGYDTRTTAHRLHQLLTTLGHDRVVYVGHDIGAWVGYAYAHEFPESLRGIALIDGNIPGVSLKSTIELEADNWRSFHFLFNAVPDLPEALLAGRERVLIEWFFRAKTASARQTFSQADIDEYERAYSMPGGLRGMLGYYRAVSEDIRIHREFAHHRIHVPLLAVAAAQGSSQTWSNGWHRSVTKCAAPSSSTAAITSPKSSPRPSPRSYASSSPHCPPRIRDRDSQVVARK